MPFKLESVLEPYAGGDEDFALWLREFETVAEASKWSAKQKSHYIVLLTKGSAKDIAREALDEVDSDSAVAYAHVVKALDSAYSLKTQDAWYLLTHRQWHKEDTVDGVLAEFRRYLKVLAISNSVANENILRESLLAALPEEVRKAIRMFEENGRQLPLADVVVKARAQLKTHKFDKDLAAAAVTILLPNIVTQYCYLCKTTGHTAIDCAQRGVGSSTTSKGDERVARSDLEAKARVKARSEEKVHVVMPVKSMAILLEIAKATDGRGCSAHVRRPYLLCKFNGEEHAIGVDTGADYSLLSASFATCLGIAVQRDCPDVVLHMMDSVGVMTTSGQAELDINYLAKDGWVGVKHTCYVVDRLAFGPLVLGADSASLYCQGMSWDKNGLIKVAAAVCEPSENVQIYDLPDTPGVRVLEHSDGTVELISNDFILVKGRGDLQFTCKWIWRGGEPPGTFFKANRGDYNPKLTPKEEEHLAVETAKLVDNGWIKRYHGEVKNILPWVLVPQPHKLSTPLRMCLDFRALNRHIVSEPIRDIVNCVDSLHQWRSIRRGYTLDVTKCYYCIKMCESLWPYLCVMIGGDIYTMVVLGFGVSIAPKVATTVIRWLLLKVPYPVSAYLDDVVIEEADPNAVITTTSSAEVQTDPPCVVVVREALCKGGMKCKPTVVIGADNSRVLGLSLHEHAGEIFWTRREDQSLEIDLTVGQSISKREVAAWCGKLTALVPIAGWLRPHVSTILRTLSATKWDSMVDECHLDLVHYVQNKVENEGDPAHGVWFCPRASDARVWHVHSDASGIAQGATLSYEKENGELVVVRDAAWLLDRRGALRHINVNELCAATRALAWAAPFIAVVYLHVDIECVRNWIERFQEGQNVRRGGLSTTIVGRRLQAIYDIAEPFNSFKICRVTSAQNPSDPLSRLDDRFLALMDSIICDTSSGIDVEADLNVHAGAALNLPILDDEMFLNLAEVVEGQYDDDDLFKIRRALRLGRLLPEGIALDLQQVYYELEIDEYDVLRRKYVAPYQGKEICVPVVPEALKVELIHSVHGLLCHVGQRRTLEAITSIAWFPNILDQTAEWLQKCDVCSRRARPLIIKHDIGLFSPNVLLEATPFSVVSADIVYLPKPYLSQQCAVSRFACLIELEGEDAGRITDAFEASWKILGKRPSILLTDNQSSFLSCDLPGVARVYTPPRSSQSNGMVESLHRTVRMWMRSIMADDAELHVSKAVIKVMKAYNNTVHSVTGRIPADMMKLQATDVEWQRLVDKSVRDAQNKLNNCTHHDLYPGAVVRLRAVNKYDKIITKTMDMPFSGRRWRVVGFVSSSKGLVTDVDDDYYSLFRKAKIVSNRETKIVHVSRLIRCDPGEVDVLDLRRAMRRIARADD
ncbi:hypothetical protein FOL47_007435 [Perkinsus chesapeaki]|uniref:Integrase catalytic domain-containing protein n=1 Tax=Perkinsus chesapeaki TaxID=330153 RepID=A0A7J6MVT9_PERCH|nr:hypothetical protein FOL47_007435 [Perkinsus chesapeaki]